MESGKNNVFPVITGNQKKFIELPTSAYEIADIETYLKKAIGDTRFSLRPNNNTLKCELYSFYDIDFVFMKCGIGNMLGYTKQKLKTYILHVSDTSVDIIKVSFCFICLQVTLLTN